MRGYPWRIQKSSDRKRCYVVCQVMENGERIAATLGMFLTGERVRYANGDGTDCRRSNLIVLTAGAA